MGKYDQEVMNRLEKLTESGTIVSWHTAVAVAKSIVEVKEKKENQHKYNVGEPWARSLFSRMNTTKRAATNSKLSMPVFPTAEVEHSQHEAQKSQ